MSIRRFIILFFVSFFPILGYSIPYTFAQHINWQGIEYFFTEKGFEIQRLVFEDAHYNKPDGLPHFYHAYPIHTTNASLSVSLTKIVTGTCNTKEKELLKATGLSDTSFQNSVHLSVSRKQAYAFVDIVPIRWNPHKKVFEKLISFEIKIEVDNAIVPTAAKQKSSAKHSVLATGKWYKIKIDKSGIYKITYQQLSSMGFPVNDNSINIGLFGNGGGILPEKNDLPRPESLTENAIEVVDGGDGRLDAGDYILFYGQGPVVWNPDGMGHFKHQNNYYDDYAYYFLTMLDHPGLRIQPESGPTGNADVEVTDFTDVAVHEKDEHNLGGTGRTWYGEIFDFTTSQSFNFNFAHLLTSKKAWAKIVLASKSFTINSFQIYTDGSLQKVVNMPITGNSGYDVGKGGSTEFEFNPTSDQISLKIDFRRSSNNAVGYLDYIDVNVRRQLTFDGQQMLIRNLFSNGTIARYHIKSDSPVRIWDISKPLQVKQEELTSTSSGYDFKCSVLPSKTFIIFNNSNFLSPEFVKTVDNQDLHNLKNIDYLIVTYPDFMDQAQRLADYHRNQDQMSVFVTTPDKIYNEFSSGTHDVTAIRDFVKHIYDNSDTGKEIKYLLLFGDASYDYKDRLPDNTNLVPCWESIQSLNTISSIASDDYFGYLDNGEGSSFSDKVDIGIGRFPVKTVEEAKNAVDKCIHYDTPSTVTMGPWRNMITFVADDDDYNHHLNDAETLASYVGKQYPVYDINKLYLDAFPQISTPSGQRAPAMNDAIDESINKGSLIFNYSGHGGEIGLGHERFLQIADINTWKNYDKLTVFITATCEFTRYDDPERTSAGELSFLNAGGGAIALFTTTRATYASSNLALNMAIYRNNLFEKEAGEYPCFGDIIRRSKVLGGNNDKKFVLIGDPASKMAYPDYKAHTTKINSKAVVENNPDTLRALSKVHIQGEITDDSGHLLDNYNGTLYPTIFDKESSVSTLGTDPGSRVTTFQLWNKILFKGKAPVKNGLFDFSFVVPKDIAYQFGRGRITYYFNNDKTDGHGYSENIIVGGYNQSASEDNDGPEIKLFMNDSLFRDGEVTHTSPVLYAQISDQSGINTTGNGIGHDIIATLDGDPQQSFNLNAYYQANEGDFTKGSIRFPLQNLSPGTHSIKLKVWDVYNNSSSAVLNFKVTPASDLVIENVGTIPNPMKTSCDFIFEHNQADKKLTVSINLFSLNGQHVAQIQKNIIPGGFNATRIHWSGRNSGGHEVQNGLYIYQLLITNQAGQTKSLNGKLLIIH